MTILVRHPPPDIGPGICYGATDVAAAPGFEAAAERLAAGLPRVARIVSSPMRRCTGFAGRLAVVLGVPLSVDPRWREMDFGAWEGCAWEAIPRAEVDAWAADLLHARPHGGETVAELAARVAAALGALAPGTLVVTHAGPIRAALGDWERAVGYGEAVALKPGGAGGRCP